jgi:CRISPR-associated exonuclease Cas4
MESQNPRRVNRHQVFSASDIERYGYCPLNWWLKKSGAKEVGTGLKDGTEKHIQVAKELDTLKKEESTLQTSEFNMKVFGIIAIILALNGIAIVTQLDFVRNFLILTAILWLIVAFVYFEIALRKERALRQKARSASERSLDAKADQDKPLASSTEETPGPASDWVRSATWFILIAGVLALNGFTIIFEIDSEILSRLIGISALLWLIGTSVILFFVLSSEAVKPQEDDWSDLKLRMKRKLTESEKLIIGFAVVAAILAINGLTIKHRDYILGLSTVGQILLVLAIVWLGVSFLFLYFAFKGGVVSGRLMREFKGIRLRDLKPDNLELIQVEVNKMVNEKLPEPERGALWFGMVALVLGVNSILISFAPQDIFGLILEVIALIWLLGASIFLYYVLRGTEIASKLRTLHGIKKGKIFYTDKIDNKEEVLVSKKYHVSGRPDSIITLEDKYIPIELKTGRVPKGPYFSHILQIAAYCALVEDKYKARPPYGIIKYGKDREFKIDFTPELNELLLEKVNEMQSAIDGKKLHRNHNRVGKCRYCSRRKKCPERLDKDENRK